MLRLSNLLYAIQPLHFGRLRLYWDFEIPDESGTNESELVMETNLLKRDWRAEVTSDLAKELY